MPCCESEKRIVLISVLYDNKKTWENHNKIEYIECMYIFEWIIQEEMDFFIIQLIQVSDSVLLVSNDLFFVAKMSRTKLIRYTTAQDEPMMIQSGKLFFEKCKGKRRSDYFGNNNPIVLELACGRGEYTVGLSQIYPNKNFIWVDIKGERMMMGIRNYKLWIENFRWEYNWGFKIQNLESPNIAFLRTIIHHIDRFFDEGEIDEIWIVHPDPRSKWHDERRRITSPRFLAMYAKILKSDGILRLKTDDDGMFEYSSEQFNQFGFHYIDSTRDLDQSPLAAHHHDIETHYGKLFKEEWRTIKYGIWRNN